MSSLDGEVGVTSRLPLLGLHRWWLINNNNYNLFYYYYYLKFYY